MKEQVIKKLTDREHILLRSGMYLGSSTLEKSTQYTIQENKFQLKELEYVPGLIKIFNELIDNSLDEHVRTKSKYATQIVIDIDSETFSIKDNGRGIPVKIAHDDIYMPEVAWTEARAGSNFEDEKSATIGTNGVGSMIASVFSKRFVGNSDDGTKKIKVVCTNNNENITSTMLKSSNPGVNVQIWPDLERFGLTEITQVHIDVIEQRIYNLSVAYPDIKFRFNKKNIKLKTKDYLHMFAEDNSKIEIIDNGKYSVAYMNSATDDFQQFSMMNGLLLTHGGTHVDILANNIVQRVRDKLVKKYKTIKPGDIKNKLFVISVLKDFEGPKYASQTKEKLTNSTKDVNEYLGDIDFDKITNRIMKNESLMDPITDYYKIKEEMKKRQDLKNLNKTTKKIKSEKYLPATKNKKVLFLCEGDSAVGGLMPALGREEFGFYACRGVPLNAYEVSQTKFTNNKELSEIYQIAQSEGYEFIATATDADADGQHIKGLFLGFFSRYLPEYLEQSRFGELSTPVQAVIKNKKMIRWIYDMDEGLNLKSGESGKYFKGLGSWKEKDLANVVKTDGITKMLKMFDLDNTEVLDNWLSGSKSDERKEYLRNNHFDITSI